MPNNLLAYFEPAYVVATSLPFLSVYAEFLGNSYS